MTNQASRAYIKRFTDIREILRTLFSEGFFDNTDDPRISKLRELVSVSKGRPSTQMYVDKIASLEERIRLLESYQADNSST